MDSLLHKESLQTAPPLKVWIAVAVILILLSVSTFHFYQAWTKDVPAFTHENLQRINSFTKAGKSDERKVVAIGNSVLFRSTFYDQSMVSFAQKLGLPKFNFLRIARTGGKLHHFLPLLKKLLKTSPDIIMLQSDLLLFPGTKERKSYRNFLKVLLFRGLEWAEVKRGPRNFLQDGRTKPRRTGEDLLKKQIRRLKRKLEGRPVKQNLLRRLLKRARQKGILVVILDVPRYYELEELKERTVNPKQSTLIDMTQKEFQLPWLRFPEQLDADCFFDYAHMNEVGRDKFSRWLLPEIARLLERGARQ